jgi:hypothetical protein
VKPLDPKGVPGLHRRMSGYLPGLAPALPALAAAPF